MSIGIISLIILAFCVILFLTEWIPSSVTAVVGCILMVLFKTCTFEEAFSGFSNSIVLLMVGAMTVGIAMFQTGTAQIIGRQIIKWSHGNTRTFIFVSCITAGVLSMFLSNTAMIAMFLPIIDCVCRFSPSMKRKDLCLPMACATMYGGAATLIGCTPQLTANGILSKTTGIEMGMWDLTRPGLCLLAICIVYTYFWGFWRGQKIWGNRPEEEMNLDEEKVRSVMETHYDRKKVAKMVCVIVLMLVFYVGGWISTAMTAMCAAILCIVLGCCDTKTVIKEINWDCVIFLGGCLGIANGLTKSGAGDLIVSAISSLLGSTVSPMAIFAVLVLLAFFVSQFITNSTAVIIVLPIALSMCRLYGFNYMPFCLGITFGASLACSTPLAAAQIAMTLVAGYKFSDYFKYTWPMSVISYFAILLFVPLFYPLVG